MTFATLFFMLSFLFALHFTATRLAKRPSITLLLMGGLLLIHGVPLLVYMHVTGPDSVIYQTVLTPMNQSEVLERLLWAMSFVFLGVVAGAAFTQRVWPKRWRMNANRSAWSIGGLHRVYIATLSMRLCLWSATLVILAFILIEGQPQKIIEYFLASGSEIDQLMLRVEGGGTRFYIYNVFLYSIAPFIVMVLWCLKKASPADWNMKILFYAFFGVVLLGKLGTLSKSPPVILLLQLAFLVNITSHARIRMRDVLKTVLLAIILFGVVANYTMPDLEVAGTLAFLYYRIFDIPNEVLVEYFAAFPYALQHTWEYGVFGSLVRPLGEVPLPNYFAVAEISRGSILSTSNAMFLGDAWADYGWLGVVFFPFLAGVAVQSVDLHAARHGRTDEWACITAGCSFAVATMLSTTLSTALVTGGLALIPLVSMLFLKPSRKRHNLITGVQQEVAP